MLLRLPLDESSAKVRTGFPLDEEEDYDLEIWAGVIPFTTVIEPPRRRPGPAGRRRDARLRRAVPAARARRRRAEPCAASSGSCCVTATLEPQLGRLLVPMIEALDERGPTPRASPSTPTRRRTPTGPPHASRVSLGRRRPGRLAGASAAPCSTLPASGADVQRFGAGAVLDLPEASLDAVADRAWPRSGPRCGCSAPAGTCASSRTPAGPPTPAPATGCATGRATWRSPTPAWPPSRP